MFQSSATFGNMFLLLQLIIPRIRRTGKFAEIVCGRLSFTDLHQCHCRWQRIISQFGWFKCHSMAMSQWISFNNNRISPAKQYISRESIHSSCYLFVRLNHKLLFTMSLNDANATSFSRYSIRRICCSMELQQTNDRPNRCHHDKRSVGIALRIINTFSHLFISFPVRFHLWCLRHHVDIDIPTLRHTHSRRAHPFAIPGERRNSKMIANEPTNEWMNEW